MSSALLQTNEPNSMARSGQASFVRLLPVIVLSSLVVLGPTFFGEPFMIIPDLISLFTTPYWSRLGDIHGRRYPLVAYAIGITITSILLFVGDLGSSIIGLVVLGLSGGHASLVGSLFAYTSDISSSPVYLAKVFSLIVGIKSLLTWAVYMIPPFHIATWIIRVVFAVLNLGYIFWYLPESYPRAVQIPDTAHKIEGYHPLGWLRVAFRALRQDKAFSIVVLSTVALSISVSLSEGILWFWTDAFYFGQRLPLLLGQVTLLISSVLLLAISLTIHVYNIREKSTQRLVLSIALLLVVLHGIIAVFALPIEEIRVTQSMGIVFILVRTPYVLLAPLLAVLAYTALSDGGNTLDAESDRGSFFGVLALLPIVGEFVLFIMHIIGTAAGTGWEFRFVANVIAVIAGVVGFGALVSVKFPVGSRIVLSED